MFPARLLLMVAALLMTSWAFADDQKELILDRDTTVTVNTGYCNIFVSRSDGNDAENPLIRVTIENTDENEIMMLFNHAYTEKDLDDLDPKITYDRYFMGSKGSRVIEPCEDLSNDLRINPTRKQEFTKKVQTGETHTFRLPFYFAKPKNKSGSKLILKEKDVIALTVRVLVKEDKDFPRLKAATDKLVDDLANITFCPNTRHNLSLERQEAPYNKLRKRLLDSVDSIRDERWNRGYNVSNYDTLLVTLKSINFKDYEKDCGRHKVKHRQQNNIIVSSHHCAYCSLSLEAIYRKMDGYYQKVYAAHGEDRNQKKRKYEGEMKALYECCMKNKQRKGSPALVSKITRLYNSFPRL